MEDLLTPLSRIYRNPERDPELLTISKPFTSSAASRSQLKCTSPDGALEILKAQPSYEELISVLKYLQQGSRGYHEFNVLQPSPQAAQVVHVLVTEIIPIHWAVIQSDASFKDGNRALKLLLGCVSSVAGINATLAHLKNLTRQIKNDPKGVKQSHSVPNIRSVIELLDHLLRPRDVIKNLWNNIQVSVGNPTKLRVLRQEVVSLMAGGKIVSLSAEVGMLLREADEPEAQYWMADNKGYVEWLGINLTNLFNVDSDDVIQLCGDLLARGLKIGHTDTLVKILYDSLLLQEEKQSLFSQLLDTMPQLDQRKVLTILLKLLAAQMPNNSDESVEDYPTVWAAAGVLKAAIGSSQARKDHLVAWLTDSTGAGLGEDCGIRRSAVAVLGGDRETITSVLEKSLAQFGDQLYVKHSPMLQQEAHAQVLLLSAGYVHRLSPIKLTILLRTGSYLSTISNRLGASQERAKFLGMVVGEALSGLVYGEEKKLNFHMDEMNSDEANWYKSLVNVSDKVGPIGPLSVQDGANKPTKTTKPPVKPAKSVSRPPPSAPKSGFIIEEVVDDDEEEEDLVSYAKPDSDDEDSDDDPTLINRNKPKAPVYIRDLIAYLRDVESYDHQKLALTTAPVLIRRKASYGTEVSSHAEELAALLVGLSNKYELDGFDEHRLQGMVAIVVAQPQKMGRWFAKTFFDGDYSLSQRASVLVVLGLSGREIAGFDTSEHALAASFPSRQLPAKVEKHYASQAPSNRYAVSSSRELKSLPANALDGISQSLSEKFLAPLAANAADATTGPDTLKLSTFTARLRNQSQSGLTKSNPVTKTGIRSIPNTTAQLLATSFFFPLTSRFLAALHSPSATTRGLLFQPELLAVYLQTLALLVHAAGPSTLSLPQMTSELWDLLLGVVRAHCCGAGELGVTRAALFGLMALLDVNEGDMRGLCQRHGREVVETVEWVSGVFDRTRGGDQGGDGEENRVKMMAAGILIRLREAVERYRALLMGDLIGVA